MSILDDLKSFEYDTNREQQFGIKSGIVWGASNKTNSLFPLLYISKPKSVSQEDYELLLKNLKIEIWKDKV